MSRFKLLCSAMLAILAVSVFASTAVAAEPEFKPAEGGFTGEGGKGKLELKEGAEVACAKNKVKGGKITGAKTVTIADIDFEGCKAFKTFAANSVGDPAETILTKEITGKLCFINKAKLEVGVVLTLVNQLHIEVKAAGALVLVRGKFIALIVNDGKATKTIEVSFKQTKGVQEPSKCEKAEEGEGTLEGALAEKFEAAGLSTEAAEKLLAEKETTVTG